MLSFQLTGVSLFVALVGDARTATDYHRAWWIFGAIGLASGLVLLLPRIARSSTPMTLRGDDHVDDHQHRTRDRHPRNE